MNGHKLPFYRLSVDESLHELRSSMRGLSKAEAADRLRHVGPNVIEGTGHTPSWIAFARQCKNLLVLTLIISAGASLYLHNYKTAVLLVLIAIANAALGFMQEHQAVNLLENIAQLASDTSRVVRGGKTLEIASSRLVPGDVVLLQAGDVVPADLRVLAEDELTTDDALLVGTGQPMRAFKHAITDSLHVGARHNMLYMGSTIITGTGQALVTATGMHTELGRIAGLDRLTRPDTAPLVREMSRLTLRITQGTLLLAAILVIVQLRSSIGIKTALLFGINIATAMTPSGLVAEVNVALAQAAARLARRRTIVKKLSAVESLGATDIITTDKTGVLTRNEPTVTHALVGRTPYVVSGHGFAPNGDIQDAHSTPLGGQALKNLHLFFQTGVLASNAEVNPPDDNHADWYVTGDTTEGALVTLARKAGIDPVELSTRLPEHKEYAFDGVRKLMTSVREVDGQLYAFVKGSPESVFARATELWDHGHVRKLAAADRKLYRAYREEHAANAERSIVFAYRILPRGFNPTERPAEDAEQKLIVLGMVTLADPLRESVPEAMASAHRAGIRVNIITGDSPRTATAVAREAGLNAGDITTITAAELTNLSDAQVLDLLLQGGAVFSRVSPQDKLRIVSVAKTAHHIVAATGSSVGDAPTLRHADIGVALGNTGTDVARQTAEVVLLDDSFTTLIGAVRQGRLSFQNIKKAIRCVLTDNMSELTTVLLGLAALMTWGIPAAITTVQIVAIDIVAQLLPITALAWDPARTRLMRSHPRHPGNHLLTRATVLEVTGLGFLAGALAYGNYLWYFVRHNISPVHLSTSTGPYLQASILTFVTIVCCQCMNLLLIRAHGQSLRTQLFGNPKLLWAFGLSAFFIINIVYNPLLQPFVGSGALTLWDWCTVLIAGGLYTLARLFHVHTKAHSRATLVKKHGAARVHAHLQRRIGKLGV